MEIYLDNSATTKPCPEAAAACMSAMEADYGNPSSLHGKGVRAEQLLRQAQAALAAALSFPEGRVLFTSGATEANNLALLGAASAQGRRGKTIITTALEHPSVLEPLRHLEEQGFRVLRLMPGPGGGYSPEQFAEAVDDDTILVSAMLVNNEVGLILPVEEIAAAVKRKKADVLVHSDFVQGFLKLPIKLRTSRIDFVSLSGHKVFAPKGVGALVVRRGVRIHPLCYGGGQQEGLRPGTEPVPLIAAFGAAIAARQGQVEENLHHYAALRRCLEEACARAGISVWNPVGVDCAPHIVSLSVKGLRSEILLHFLERHEIFVSSGSACSRGGQSHVLSALGFDRETADGTLRVSFSPETTIEMLQELAVRLKEGADSLQR